MTVTKSNPFDKIAEEYDQWYVDYKYSFLSELEAIKYFIPASGVGIEIGVGTGRFAVELGIRHGIEPSQAMAAMAMQRGVDVMICTAENIPLADESYDFAVMVAVDPFVDDIEQVYREIFRILKPGGKLVVGTLHRDGAKAQKYMNMTDSEVYMHARFHTVGETIDQLKKNGFSGFETCQTLFAMHPDIIEKPLPGHDRGSFIAIEAIK
ncbi:MAG: class I SAM-dependent methyltransferase [Cyclobacteriaceae bacterium]|nr:class I SAM-dependent methyltransferase [Cyclobacteriaceae bacterium]